MEFETKGLTELPMVEQRVNEMLKKDSTPEGRKKSAGILDPVLGRFFKGRHAEVD
jgi:hypothetical protein